MTLPINIEDLLSGLVVESNRVEYKRGWNPDPVYRSICAFANDFEDTCGGYIVIGVEEVNGRAVRPVIGIDLNQVDAIEKAMVGYNNLIEPFYLPRVFFEPVDGKVVMVIWVPAGERRPYRVPDRVTGDEKKRNYYIRYNSSSIVARDEYLSELIDLANKAPFDDRGNIKARLEDVSMMLIRDYLVETKSALANEMEKLTPMQVLEQMNLLEGPPERSRIKNVALMMFSNRPERFFPGTQIDVVFYPQGKDADPNNFFEEEPFRGPVHVALRNALYYLRHMLIIKKIHKPKDDEHSEVVYNYPYQALEESLVNAYYHRRYDEYQSVEVNILPDMIEIISYGGAERSINLADLRQGKRVHARRYRNPRLGEFFKELHLTEGRGTGFPTIRDELRHNGSPDFSIETDEEHTYFIIRIPCHRDFVGQSMSMDRNGHILPFGDSVDKESSGADHGTDGADNDADGADNVADGADNDADNGTDGADRDADDADHGTDGADRDADNGKLSALGQRRTAILRLMKSSPKITIVNLAEALNVSRRTIQRDLESLRNAQKIRRDGDDHGGTWQVL